MSKIYICNKCGRVLDFFDKEAQFTIAGKLGYGTKYDGEELALSLCCNCMESLIDSCVVSPIIENT